MISMEDTEEVYASALEADAIVRLIQFRLDFLAEDWGEEITANDMTLLAIAVRIALTSLGNVCSVIENGRHVGGIDDNDGGDC